MVGGDTQSPEVCEWEMGAGRQSFPTASLP